MGTSREDLTLEGRGIKSLFTLSPQDEARTMHFGHCVPLPTFIQNSHITKSR